MQTNQLNQSSDDHCHGEGKKANETHYESTTDFNLLIRQSRP